MKSLTLRQLKILMSIRDDPTSVPEMRRMLRNFDIQIQASLNEVISQLERNGLISYTAGDDQIKRWLLTEEGMRVLDEEIGRLEYAIRRFWER